MAGRTKSLHSRKLIAVRLMPNLIDDLKKASETMGKSQTYVIECAIFSYMNTLRKEGVL